MAKNNGTPWNTMTLNLPRTAPVSHLGFEPHGGLYRRGGTPAGRLLFDLIRIPTKLKAPPSHPPIPKCSWQSMI